MHEQAVLSTHNYFGTYDSNWTVSILHFISIFVRFDVWSGSCFHQELPHYHYLLFGHHVDPSINPSTNLQNIVFLLDTDLFPMKFVLSATWNTRSPSPPPRFRAAFIIWSSYEYLRRVGGQLWMAYFPTENCPPAAIQVWRERWRGMINSYRSVPKIYDSLPK